jgi:hypothetical protein
MASPEYKAAIVAVGRRLKPKAGEPQIDEVLVIKHRPAGEQSQS